MSASEIAPGSLRKHWATAEGFAIDLDGTLVCDGAVIEGAERLLETTAGRFVIVSNNSSDTASSLSRKLAGLGLAVAPELLVLAGETTLKRVAAQWPGAKVMLLAAPALQRFARRLGLRHALERPDLVVLARDLRFTYRKLAGAANALRAGAQLIVTNPDHWHPGQADMVVPETGALMKALVAASGVAPVEIVGKPEPGLLREALHRIGTPPERTLVIGDNPLTDGVGAARLGMPYLLLGKAKNAIATTPGKLLELLASPVSALASSPVPPDIATPGHHTRLIDSTSKVRAIVSTECE
jgi:HAD superfamily hydrolase (TIGR01450 family)